MSGPFGSPEDPNFLPSARQAMRQAVEIASKVTSGPDNFERARLWVTIAAELRMGTMPIPLRTEVLEAEGVPAKDETELLDFGQRFEDVPAEAQVSVPLYREVEQTQIIEDIRCVNCLGSLVLAPGAIGEEMDANETAWRHRATQQRVCPTEWEGGQHTFAEPNIGHQHQQ